MATTHAILKRGDATALSSRAKLLIMAGVLLGLFLAFSVTRIDLGALALAAVALALPELPLRRSNAAETATGSAH